MQCQTGCADCCHVRLTITTVEAAAIRALVTGWPSERRRTLAPTGPTDERSDIAEAGDLPREIDKRSGIAGGGDPDGSAGGAGVLPRGIDRCAALDGAGRCKIYEARPLVCRSHGVPIRLRRGSLPVVQACHRNFTHTTADPDCILDQVTLSAMLYAVDAAEAGAAGSDHEAGRRIDLAGLLADLAAI